MMQIKGRSRKRAQNEFVQEERQTRECGMSGADKSRHALRWEDHHGDELNLSPLFGATSLCPKEQGGCVHSTLEE